MCIISFGQINKIVIVIVIVIVTVWEYSSFPYSAIAILYTTIIHTLSGIMVEKSI